MGAETPGATAGFLEFTGQGLTTFERAMDRDEQLMAVLGTRMLESRKRVGETAAAIELRQSGENSILNTVSLSVSASLTQVLRWVYWWNSTEPIPDAIGPDLVLASLNTDFSITGMSFQEITALVAAWQAGAISQDTMLDLFRAGEVIAPGRTNEEEIKLLANEKQRSRRWRSSRRCRWQRCKTSTDNLIYGPEIQIRNKQEIPAEQQSVLRRARRRLAAGCRWRRESVQAG
jgi:hypothetical protein